MQQTSHAHNKEGDCLKKIHLMVLPIPEFANLLIDLIRTWMMKSALLNIALQTQGHD